MPGGRPSNPIVYRDVIYNDKTYVVGTVMHNSHPIQFVIDKEDFQKIEGKQWHVAAGNYIAYNVCHEGKRKACYMHNVIMNAPLHPGKGATSSVDHINRNGFDNRKENLQIVSQSEQNLNQRKKPRTITLPENCGINPDTIPRHIWYIKPNGGHGDRFAIEFKTEDICWKTTSSKSVTLVEKIQDAKQKLSEFYVLYPYLNPTYYEQQMSELIQTYNAIAQS
jgi:hypothetical protein